MFCPGRTTQQVRAAADAEESLATEVTMAEDDCTAAPQEPETRVVEMDSESATLAPVWTPQMSVVQLRAAAKTLHLAASGTKQQLIHRLSAAAS
jgi:hypothetical protein